MYEYCRNNCIVLIDPYGYDAIYVIDYDRITGLPVLGHSVLCFQDTNGKWYYTEYSGGSKPSAKVTLYALTNTSFNRLFGKISKSLIATSGTKFIYIKGNFSACLKKAKSYVQNGFGKYNLIFNNCLNYVQKVLCAGKCSLGLTILCKTPFIAPNAFGNALAAYLRIKTATTFTLKFMNKNIKLVCNPRF